ncbi:MAG: alpha/beta hydrolase [Bacteroidota bacterium]
MSTVIRIAIFLSLLIYITNEMSAQTSLKEIGLEMGAYQVGFKYYQTADSTRTYRMENEFSNRVMYRPMPISIWYPAKAAKATPLTVLDYLEVLKEEEEWEYVPNRFLLDWFPYLWNTPENHKHLSEQATAISGAEMLKQEFPVVIYTPSYQASSIENFALCEYLASHGYFVISSPSRGTKSRKLEGGTTKDMETQSGDVAFLLKEVHRYPSAYLKNIALVGFSFGGLSNVITVMKRPDVKAVVSLDGTERYKFTTLEASPYYQIKEFDIPYVHFAQKDIPEEVLKSEKLPKGINSEFQFYDSLIHSTAYRYKFNDLTHSYFSSFGVLFASRDKRQDKSDAQIMKSYNLMAKRTLQFLDAFLLGDPKARQFMENSPAENGISKDLLLKQMKKPLEKPFTYKDFNDLAYQQNYEDLIALYEAKKKKYPKLHLKERMLNTLGLWLSFDPERNAEGIRVLLLALHLYPESANLYDSLAEAYLAGGNTKNAIINFKKSLERSPDNQNALDRLKELR